MHVASIRFIFLLSLCSCALIRAQVIVDTYNELQPQQRRLIQVWLDDYKKVSGKTLEPDAFFESLPVSQRTTFQAVTHALLTTPLTDQSGKKFGTVLDVVDRVEHVAGKVEGASGDEQYRIYISLKPDAYELLDRSKEFKRGMDNTVYHKGYPICFRQGGLPSIQISMTHDRKRADIDVDYRSSRFPASLVNGHLTASNSDVRAGNNHERHVGRWEGLENWWASWFGMARKDKQDPSIQQVADGTVPTETPKGKGKLEDATNDLLTAWLVDQNPRQALAYFSPKSFSCLLLHHSETDTVNRGLAPAVILRDMKYGNEAMGKVASLEGVVEAVTLQNPQVKLSEHQYSKLFSLYEVPESLGVRHECDYVYGGMAPPKNVSDKFGKYFATVLRLKGQGGKSAVLRMLWAKEDGNWRIVSFDTEPEAGTGSPDLRPKIEAVKVETMPGDAQMLQSNLAFLSAWLVKRDVPAALRYVSPRGLACAGLYKSAETAMPSTNAERQKMIVTGMNGLLNSRPAARGAKLADYIASVQIVNPGAHHVRQPHSTEFTVFGIPDHAAEVIECANRVRGQELKFKPVAEPKYGNYFVSAFKVVTPGSEGDVLYLMWGKDQGAWKIASFHVEQH